MMGRVAGLYYVVALVAASAGLYYVVALVAASAFSANTKSVAPPETKLVVLRSGGHSGSNWLSSLLAERGIKTFFQFYGECNSYAKDGRELRDTLLNLLEVGCGCSHGSHLDDKTDMLFTCSHAELKSCRKQQPLCSKEGCSKRSTQCDAVAVVGDPSLELDPVVVDDWSLNGLEGVEFATWDRNNVVKKAISTMKSHCSHPAFDNHHSIHSKQLTRRGFVFVDDEPGFVNRVAGYTSERIRLNRTADALTKAGHLGYSAHYEDFQLDAPGELNKMLPALNLARYVTPTDFVGSLVKITPEGLDSYVINFDQLDATFAPWPCIQQQFRSVIPQRSEPCKLDSSFTSTRPAYFERHPTLIDCATQVCETCSLHDKTNSQNAIQAICAQARHFAEKNGIVDKEPPIVCAL